VTIAAPFKNPIRIAKGNPVKIVLIIAARNEIMITRKTITKRVDLKCCVKMYFIKTSFFI